MGEREKRKGGEEKGWRREIGEGGVGREGGRREGRGGEMERDRGGRKRRRRRRERERERERAVSVSSVQILVCLAI